MKDEFRPPSSFIRHPLTFLIVALLFLAARIALLLARRPFFDELFSVWMARQPLARVVPNLLHDSGPPLYYWLARFDSVHALRWLSLVFAAAQLAVVVAFFSRIARRGAPHPAFGHPLPAGEGSRIDTPDPRLPLLAAALLAVYPPAVLFAVDARGYALCALFVMIGVLALAAERPFLAAGAFVVAACSHYYGVLFFPVILTGVAAGFRRSEGDGGVESAAPLKVRALAFAAACIAFVPGFILASQQPSQALGWNREPLFAPLLNLSWAGMYPESLFATWPIAAALAGTLVLLMAVTRSWRFAPAVLVPLALVLLFHLAGRPVYFPMRFEAILAGPLVLWVASSLTAQRGRRAARVTAVILMLFGAISVAEGVWSHLHRPADPYRAAANELREHVGPGDAVVATGFCYLETVVALNRPVLAWPAGQARHPGWRAQAPGDVRELPRSAFLWIGERQSVELARLREARRIQPLLINERAVIARVEGLTAPLH